MNFLMLVSAGASVGFAIGLTGVGGGSLMTPILLLFNYPAPVAIGTDLLYAAITKSGGVYFHQKKGNVKWRVMALLLAGSVPVSILVNVFVLNDADMENHGNEDLLLTALGIMLVITSFVIAFQKKIQKRISQSKKPNPPPHLGFTPPYYGYAQKNATLMTLILGMALGLCVTLTSVGAGAFGAAVLFLLYPDFKATKIVGTDIAHAVPLTFVAGLGYLYNGLVDYTLLGSLLCGSIPGIYLGTRMGSRLPEKIMRRILVTALFSFGIYFSLFA